MRIKPIVQVELVGMALGIIFGLFLDSGILDIPGAVLVIKASGLIATLAAAGMGAAVGAVIGALIGMAFALEEWACSSSSR